MKKGKLSQTEKYAIQGMLAEGKPLGEIKQVLDRETGTAVDSYITKELDSILNTVVKARIQRTDEEWTEEVEATEESTVVEDRSDRGNQMISSKELIKRKLENENAPEITLDEEVRKEAVQKLRGLDMSKREAEELIFRASKKLNRQPRNGEEMFQFCLRQMNILNHMITNTQNSNDDSPKVAIMTGAASAVSDHAKNNRRPSERKTGSIYCPKTGEFK